VRNEILEIHIVNRELVLPPKVDVIPGAGGENSAIEVVEEEEEVDERTIDYGPGFDEDHHVIDIDEDGSPIAVAPRTGSLNSDERTPLLGGRSSKQLASVTSLPKPE